MANCAPSYCWGSTHTFLEGNRFVGWQDSGLEFTFIRVGEMIEGKEGGAVVCGNVTSELPQEQVVRDDIIRLSAESFVMQNTTGKVRPSYLGQIVNGLCAQT